jgi:hypothetical protein
MVLITYGKRMKRKGELFICAEELQFKWTVRETSLMS